MATKPSLVRDAALGAVTIIVAMAAVLAAVTAAQHDAPAMESNTPNGVSQPPALH